ncbi:hypothetical protein DQ244_11225 [Blastococcus sp. TBT05-19]|nr:hypothetical protein DQ244_11225 [Blastococcus sp. TBT05-19]
MTTSAFVGDPQPVEIHHLGIWYSGELLGWRHTSDGRVSARVRCTVDGLRHSTWKDLSELRLPDPAHPPRREPYPAARAWPVPDADEVDVDDDRTRPNHQFTGLSVRPRKPGHVGTPPAPAPLPQVPPAARTAAPTARPRPTPYRRSAEVDQSDPWSRDWTAARSWGNQDDRLSPV